MNSYARPLRTAALLCFLPTISGCSGSEAAREAAEAARLGPVTVDVAPIRCPDLDPRVEAARRAKVAPPPNTTNADGGTGLDDDAVRAWVDRYEAAVARKDNAIDVASEAYRRCRSPEGASGANTSLASASGANTRYGRAR